MYSTNKLAAVDFMSRTNNLNASNFQRLFAVNRTAILLFCSWKQWKEMMEAVHIKQFLHVVLNVIQDQIVHFVNLWASFDYLLEQLWLHLLAQSIQA